MLHPRLTVLVTCKGRTSPPNIISVAWCMPMSFDPPLLGICLTETRYSFQLIQETQEFVVNIPTFDMSKDVMWIGRKSGRDYDKFKETGLTPLSGESVQVPHIKECIGWIECTVQDTIKFGDHYCIVGQVLKGATQNSSLQEIGRYHKSTPLLYYYLDGVFGTLGNQTTSHEEN